MRANSWNDAAGHPWPIVVNTSLIRVCREQLQVELVDVPAIFDRLASDVPLLAGVLWLASRDLAKERKIEQSDFENLLIGDVWEGAANALADAIVDFFPSSRRNVLRTLREKQKAVIAEGLAIGQRQLANPKLDSALTGALQQAEADIEAQWSKLGSGSTSLPATAASIPAPTHSAS